MKIAKIQDGTILQIGEHTEFSELSSSPSANELTAHGFMYCNLWRDHDLLTEKLISCTPVIEGDWVYVVSVASKTEDDIARDKALALARIRETRDALLDACDFTQTEDYPGDKAAWATYRQALRDFPASNADARLITDWPHSPTWAATPSS